MDKEKIIQEMKDAIEKDKNYIIKKSKSVDKHLKKARKRK